MRKIGNIEIIVPEVIPSGEIFGYRNKAVFEVGKNKDGEVISGFYRERSHDIIPAKNCALQSNTANRAAEAVCDWLNGKSVPVRNLMVRSNAISSQAVIVIEKPINASGIVNALREKCPELTGISVCVNTDGGNVVLKGGMQTVWGEPHFNGVLGGYEFRVSPSAFFQVNANVAERLYTDICKSAMLSKDDTALDLYCGAGTITLSLARLAGFVYGAEIVPGAVENARANALRNGVSNVEFICGDADKAAGEFLKRGIKPRVTVVDPPRKGLSAAIIQKIVSMKSERIIYVSCDPATLARDLKPLRETGYVIKTVQPYDMFPRCAHVECMAVLSKDC